MGLIKSWWCSLEAVVNTCDALKEIPLYKAPQIQQMSSREIWPLHGQDSFWPAGEKESHNNSGICTKEQEELSVCCLRYPLFLLFVQEWSLVPAARKSVISAPEQANNTISKSRDGQTSPTHLLLTGSSHDFIGSLYPSIHPSIGVHPTRDGAMCHLPFKSTKQQRREWISRKMWHCRTYKHVPGIFNKGKIALIYILPKDKRLKFFWQQCCVQLNTHPCHVYVLWMTFPLRPPLHRLLLFFSRKVIFAAYRLAVMSLDLPHPPCLGQV